MSNVGNQMKAIFVAVVLLGSAGAVEAQIGACCRGDGVCLLTDSAGCAVVPGEFLGAGTSCAPNICVGACCTTDKGCVENFRNTCTNSGGSFQGVGTTCDLNCPSHLGTGFIYQGQLKQGGVPLSDSVDLEFSLWTAGEGGEQVGDSQTVFIVDLENGFFTVSLDFGKQAFAGNSRWLEAAVRHPHDPTDTAPYATLNPRHRISATPYASTALSALSVPGIDGHSLDAADGNPTDALFVDNSGKVGIGTTTPAGQLNVVGDILFDGYGGARSVIGREAEGTSAAPSRVLSGAALAVFGGAGYDGTAFSAPQGFMRITSAEAWTTTARATNIDFFTTPLGSTALSQRMLIANNGNVGIGTSTPTARLSVSGSADFSGNVGIGTTTAGAPLHVSQPNAFIVARFSRIGSDGTLLSFVRDTLEVGNISATGGIVSYNAFTGSHYAWSGSSLEPGVVVSMTGVNRRHNEQSGGEVVYGVMTTSSANDPACLGVYLNLEEPSKPPGPANPLLVAAVGNGELCVVDQGTDIHPGDLLISSDVPGCAMRDDPARFAVGYVIGRAAQQVEWEGMPADEKGPRRTRISVLFDRFVRSGDPSRTTTALDSLKAENEELQNRLGRLESVLFVKHADPAPTVGQKP